MAMEATMPPAASPPGDEWRILPSGVLAYRLPPTKAGKQIWLGALRCVKVCEHGHSAAQMRHWRCTARPRAKPEWVVCCCTDTDGLYMSAAAPKPELPATVPAYHCVLWRDAQPTMLSPKGVLAVRVPGMPKGQEVFLDARGTPRCAHGFTVHELMRQQRAQLRGCATGRTAHEVCGCSLRGR